MKTNRIPTVFTILLILLCTRSFGQATWEKLYTGYNYIFTGIDFPGGQSQNGFAGGMSVTYMGNGIVIKTVDGGTTWTPLWTGTQQGIEGISFPDLNTGYVGGWSAYFAKTIDGGVTWTPQTLAADLYYITDIVFKDANHGIVTAQTNTNAAVYVTSDGGATWTTVTGLPGVPYGACYAGGSTYYIATNGGDVIKSINDGLNWTTVFTGAGLLLGVDFYNTNIGIAAGEDGWIFKTYDGGITWSAQQTAYGNPLWHDFAWASQNEVYSAGTPETIWKSMNGGTTWENDYPQSTMNPALYEIIHTNDNILYSCGSQGFFYRKVPQVTAAFSANTTHLCQGGSVQFTDQSLGSPVAWNWTFEGGTPSTSTLQNPLVTYADPGTFDVTLTVSLSSAVNTLTNPDMIIVDAPLNVAPAQPTGQTEICGLSTHDYTTSAIANIGSYTWAVDPANTGTITGTGLTGTLIAGNTAIGPFTVKVRGNNTCGAGPWSPLLACNLNLQPNPYYLYSGGAYCPGDPGYEVRLEDSDPGVSYELFRDGVTTGVILPGTGNELSFGLQPAGSYSITGTAGACSGAMNGSCINFQLSIPGQASVPAGPNVVCDNENSTYSGVLPSDASGLSWTLTPANSGLLTPNGLNVSVEWTVGFSGTASLAVAGENECGAGASSTPLLITVNASPDPAISGLNEVCQYTSSHYQVDDNPDSDYNWSVTGCSSFSGQNTYQITVEWGVAGPGTVQVTESTGSGCTGNAEVFPVNILNCTRSNEVNAGTAKVYPNPANDVLYIVSGDAIHSIEKLDIIDQTGKTVTHLLKGLTISQDMVCTDTSLLPEGAYILRLILNEGTVLFHKVLIQHE